MPPKDNNRGPAPFSFGPRSPAPPSPAPEAPVEAKKDLIEIAPDGCCGRARGVERVSEEQSRVLGENVVVLNPQRPAGEDTGEQRPAGEDTLAGKQKLATDANIEAALAPGHVSKTHCP